MPLSVWTETETTDGVSGFLMAGMPSHSLPALGQSAFANCHAPPREQLASFQEGSQFLLRDTK